ncbi:MFS transporter [Synechococcus sp. Nb3U1]|uniref:MFS transporter n=1 Tax=Synechococcus sp. Nb3U1 TaxID=1914529 RepID=UPI001F338253|nr:MFS transporter [Synechococcus sp. Nb3U1]MCF2971756.1 MFS transporter [Synechococcus sp. Nb3U1]
MTEQRLSLWTKLAYGVGDLGTGMTANILVFFLLPFLTNTVGMAAGLAGSIYAITRFWDAINDPVIGILSDRTRTRWGRRRPWLLFAAIPFGLTFLAQWWIPFPGRIGALFAYYLLVSLLFNTFYSAANIPYASLTPELTQDYDERMQLNQFRFAFSIGGSIVAVVLFPLLYNLLPDRSAGYMLAGTCFALISSLPLLLCFWGVRERYQSERDPLPLAQQMRVAFRNRPYLFVIGIYLCSWLTFQFTATIIPYFIVFWMGLPEVWISLTVLAVQGIAVLTLFMWTQLSAHLGKRTMYLIGAGFWLISQAGLFFLQPGQSGIMIVLALIAGVGVSATAYLGPWSMIPDVIDLDELETGERREGIFYAFMVLLQKVGLALGLFFVGQALDLAGFISYVAGEAPPIQPESALLAIRFAIGPLPAVSLVGGILLVWFYPITRQQHQQILAELEENRQKSRLNPEKSS